MNDYTQPSAFKSVDTVSQNAESLKFVKEMSDGPFIVRHEESLHHVDSPEGTVASYWSDFDAQNAKNLLNKFWHYRDSEMESKDARIKELEAQVKELEVRLCSTAVMLNRKRIGYE